MTYRGGAVFLLWAGLVLAQPEESRAAQQLRALKAEFRKLTVRATVEANGEARLRLLEEISQLDDEVGDKFLVDMARDDRHADIRAEFVAMLATKLPDSVLVDTMFREHLEADDPLRPLALDYLLRRAVMHRDPSWLSALFEQGSLKEKFLALQALGKIRAPGALDAAWRLAANREWTPVPGTIVSCSTIATSVKRLEGRRAARLLLLLRRDARFQPQDELAMREATRLWGRRNLKSYIELFDLAHASADKRAETARFMGDAGIETARAPLLTLARDRSELSRVRAAATEALGGLRVARGDLVAVLKQLVEERDGMVRRAAVSALGRLGVRQAARALVDLLDTPLAEQARAALARLSGLAADTNWRDWWTTSGLRLPEGT